VSGLRLIGSVLSAAWLAGCSQITYRDRGVEFTRTSFGTQTQITELTAKINPEGANSIRLQGYTSDQVESLKAVAEGVAKGLKAAP